MDLGEKNTNLIEDNKEIEKKDVEKKDVDEKDLHSLNQQELTEHLNELIEDENLAPRDVVNQIKQLFYKHLNAENENQKKEFIEAGGEEMQFVPEKNPYQEEFKELLEKYKQKRTEYNANIEKERADNLLQKQHILNRMKVLVDTNDDVSAHIAEFRDLQSKWKEIGQVPQSENNKLWREYSSMTEAFWDLIKINNELREYDFRKNLETKTALCESAEALDKETDIISASRKLQQLHEKWRETGPVAREYREEIWQRFKEASSAINRKHQQHFDELRKTEHVNYELKLALCEKIEAFDYSKLDGYKAWDEATKTIIGWQEEWRSIGFAPRKLNNKIFLRYRAACDKFFNAKSEFYKDAKKRLNENLEQKKELCEQAEAMKDSSDWKEATDFFVKVQKEWKAIGPVPRKHSDEIWKRFIAACDHFFERKNKENAGERANQKENLIKKKEILSEIEALIKLEEVNPEETLVKLREYISKWNQIGFVPFKDKDKIQKEYRTALDKMFDKLNIDKNQRKLDMFKTSLKDIGGKGQSKLLRERDKLMRSYDHLKSEIATYENNIGFLTSSDKKGSGLIKEMERKVENLRSKAEVIEQQINMIDESL